MSECLATLSALRSAQIKADSPLSAQLQPLIVFVPHGNAKAPTRPPAFYDETYAFLVSCGILAIK